ncbi:GNAT family N-acetyltransferase [Lacticaseibacillus mingshuiensis]|uniref:GNAT family N-acetyltransferase n=1 Tax=Lacticaseibacillus mingshuiensis TaxID=2799574 RepID=UPI00194F8F32|nr:GNAT family N-acetyltransferase [Lacticaseibacillus mingshuiensis]
MLTFEPITQEYQLQQALTVYQANQAYFDLTQEVPTASSVRRDLATRPDGISATRKLFALIREGKEVRGVLDILHGYPDAKTDYIGLLLIAEHHQGWGTKVVQQSVADAQKRGVQVLTLAVLVNNPNARGFWQAMAFTAFGDATAQINGRPFAVQLMRREL